MKTSEFIEYFEDKGHRIFRNDFYLSVVDEKDFIFIDIEFDMDITVYFSETDLTFSEQQEYYKVIFEYLMTPLEEREEEKKYKLQQKGVAKRDLIWLKELCEYTTGKYPYENENVKTVFAQSEIDNMPECYTHPAVWEKIEVESEEE